MHYGDKEQIDNNILKIVVYKHTILDEKEETDYDLVVNSIQECKYFPINLLRKILEAPEILKLNLEPEKWYLITIKTDDGWLKTTIVDIEDVSLDKNDFYKLH